MKIFANEILLNILEKPCPEAEGMYMKVKSAAEIMAVYEQIRDIRVTNVLQYNFETENYEQIVCDLKACFIVIRAAGGIVTKGNRVLFIKRMGKWDLPKGKIDKGENKEAAAVREVEEECGVKARIIQKVGTTWHTFVQDKRNKLKKTTWYEMVCYDDKDLKPQKEEDITKVRWVKLDKTDSVLGNTYNSIRYIYKRFEKKKRHERIPEDTEDNQNETPLADAPDSMSASEQAGNC